MDDIDKLYEQIEDYLSNDMGQEDRQLFEERISKDDALKKEVDSFRLAQQAIIATGRDAIKNLVDDALKKTQPVPTSSQPEAKVFNLKRVLSIAAVFLALAVATFLLFQKNTSNTPSELFATHFELPIASNVRSVTNNTAEQWNLAVKNFNKKNYTKAIEIISPLLNDASFDYSNEGYLFLGLSQLQIDKNSAALNSFNQVNQASTFKQDANWFTALTFLKMNNLEKAKSALEKISKSNNTNKRKAQEILEAL